MHFTTEKVTSKCDFLSLKQVYAHFCTALYMCVSALFYVAMKKDDNKCKLLEK